MYSFRGRQLSFLLLCTHPLSLSAKTEGGTQNLVWTNVLPQWPNELSRRASDPEVGFRILKEAKVFKRHKQSIGERPL